MNIYDKTGYLNIEGLLSQPFVFNFFIGGRGTGKTYGILKYILDHDLKVLFVRRLQSQVDIISKPEFNPFLAVDDTVEVKSASKYHAAFFRDGRAIGYMVALSTFSKIRGFDASDIDIIFYDEFIPELHERPIKNEESALFNAYETTNRNRELQGRKPVKLVCAANSNRIDNPILQGFGLLRRLEKMIRTGKELYQDKDKSLQLVYLSFSPISEQKEDTALYRALHGSQFSEMSLGNRFAFSADRVQSRNLKQYRILFRIGDIGFYSDRQKGNSFYVRITKETARRNYENTVDGIKEMRMDFPYIQIWNIQGYIFYEDLDVYTRFAALFRG